MDFKNTQHSTIELGKAANEAASRSKMTGAVKQGGKMKLLAGLDVLVKEGLTVDGVAWRELPEATRERIKITLKAHLESGALHIGKPTEDWRDVAAKGRQ